MRFTLLKSRLATAFQNPLPGEAAHYKMAPSGRPQNNTEDVAQYNPNRAGVMAVFEKHGEEAALILIRRNEYPGVHSGQISLPGGRLENSDKDLLHTALRETREEVGITSSLLQVQGTLTPLYIPPSNFWVQPYVALSEDVLDLTRQESEVKHIHRIPVSEWLSDSAVQHVPVKIANGQKIQASAFVVQDLVIWGATAMMLSELKMMLME